MIGDEKWNRYGKLQLDFLIGVGLQPHHTVVDIGCSDLRGGRWLIDYLDAGNYTGLEKDDRRIDESQAVIEEYGLFDKDPIVIRTSTFEMPHEAQYDFAWAHAIFTHLTLERIVDCLQAVREHAPLLYASFLLTSTATDLGPHPDREGERKLCTYAMRDLQTAARRAGVTVKLIGAYGHPRHKMTLFTW